VAALQVHHLGGAVQDVPEKAALDGVQRGPRRRAQQKQWIQERLTEGRTIDNGERTRRTQWTSVSPILLAIFQ
jgi:hypothetical protein